MSNADEQCVIEFIDNIWNNSRFELASRYLHPAFTDHALPTYCQNKLGFILYLKTLNRTGSHKTNIRDLVCEGDMVMVRFEIESSCSSGDQTETKAGHRYFRMSDEQIIDHWEIFDRKA